MYEITLKTIGIGLEKMKRIIRVLESLDDMAVAVAIFGSNQG
jgi:hypothetical protein